MKQLEYFFIILQTVTCLYYNLQVDFPILHLKTLSTSCDWSGFLLEGLGFITTFWVTSLGSSIKRTWKMGPLSCFIYSGGLLLCGLRLQQGIELIFYFIITYSYMLWYYGGSSGSSGTCRCWTPAWSDSQCMTVVHQLSLSQIKNDSGYFFKVN